MVSFFDLCLTFAVKVLLSLLNIEKELEEMNLLEFLKLILEENLLQMVILMHIVDIK